MFKNDRMMLILTGLVLAIFAGSMVQYGDRIMAMFSGNSAVATEDDSYSVRAGARQVLDVLSNDKVNGPIVVLSGPSCGAVELTSNNRLSFSSDANCSGEVEFAYCVDVDGSCDPKSVKINVISVNFAQENSSSPAQQSPAETQRPAPSEQAQNTTELVRAPVPAPPAPATDAPEIASFSVEMAPPALAPPSVNELVSPDVAVASIRRSAVGLESASTTTDRNIATQNSASVSQTATASPSVFAAPNIGESSNISLGGSERAVTTAMAAPRGLTSAPGAGNNITPLERGPEALITLQIAQTPPAAPEASPLSANPEQNGGAPVFVAAAQTNRPAPDTKFSATPVDGGPIALVALGRTPTRSTGAGESLNLILSEPGLQSFVAPSQSPSALAPASARPSSISVLERGPSVNEAPTRPAPPESESASAVQVAMFHDPLVAGAPLSKPALRIPPAPYTAVGTQVSAVDPIPFRAPSPLLRKDTFKNVGALARGDSLPARIAGFAGLALPDASVFSLPQIDLQPAEKPQVLQASLPVVPDTPTETAPAQNSGCDIVLTGTAQRGAIIALDINAACKPDQMVTIEHSGIAFSVLTDETGAASVKVPAMEAEAEISVQFADQSVSHTVVNVSDIASVVRAGVSWQTNMNLDLTAIEFGAAIGSEGYVTPENPRDYRTSRVKGGGYLVQLGDPGLERGALAEVYTLPTTRNQQRGTIALTVAIHDVAPVCGQTITARTVRTREGRSASIRNVRFTVPSCGTIVSGQVALPGAIDDIRLAGR